MSIIVVRKKGTDLYWKKYQYNYSREGKSVEELYLTKFLGRARVFNAKGVAVNSWKGCGVYDYITKTTTFPFEAEFVEFELKEKAVLSSMKEVYINEVPTC